MWTPEERGSIVGQYTSKLAAARRRRDRRQPPYPHDNEILKWRGEAENPLDPLLVVGRWVTLDQVQKVYGLKTRSAVSAVISNLQTRGFKFDKGGKGRWRLNFIPPFQEPKNVPVFIEKRVVKGIRREPGSTGQELQGRDDLNEGQVRSAVDSFRARRTEETVEGHYQPGFQVARRRPTR